MADELPARSMDCQSAQITHIGDRQSNQDAQDSVRKGGLACFVVSDGAGGHLGGEVASATAVKSIIDSFLRELSFGLRPLQFYVGQAVAMVEQGQKATDELNQMSATVAVVLIDNENRCALWAHLGDTRIYLFRHKKIHSVTRDHSLVQRFIDAGYCSVAELRTHPQRSVLYAAVGMNDETQPEITEEAVPLCDGDAILVCTDGFWEWIDEDEMEKSMNLAVSVEDWLQRMYAVIEQNSHDSPKFRDNCTAQAIWFRDAA